jgi:hypothetical protein
VAKGLKSYELEERALTAMKLAFSQIYVQIAWMLLALCGTSEVLLIVLRFIYMIGMGFFIGQMIYTILMLFSVRSVVYQQLGDEAQRLLEEEDEVDEDERDTLKRKKRTPDEDEEDEDEEDED